MKGLAPQWKDAQEIVECAIRERTERVLRDESSALRYWAGDAGH